MYLKGSVTHILRQQVLGAIAFGMREEFRRRILLDDLALVHEYHLIRHRSPEAHFVRDALHRDPRAGKLDHHVEHFQDRDADLLGMAADLSAPRAEAALPPGLTITSNRLPTGLLWA